VYPTPCCRLLRFSCSVCLALGVGVTSLVGTKRGVWRVIIFVAERRALCGGLLNTRPPRQRRSAWFLRHGRLGPVPLGITLRLRASF